MESITTVLYWDYNFNYYVRKDTHTHTSNITTPNIIMVDEATKRTLAAIPLLRTRAGPRDGDQWVTRLKEEYTSLIKVEWTSNAMWLKV